MSCDLVEEYPNLNSFITYFEKTYKGSLTRNEDGIIITSKSMLQANFWNHYDTTGMPQTNNNIEAYNLKLKKYIGIAHPNIYKSIDVFSELEVEANQKYAAAKEGLPDPYRRKIDLKHSIDLTMLKSLLRDNSITIDIYIQKVLNI